MVFTMLLEPCELPPTTMFSKHEENKVSEIITQPTDKFVGFF